MEVEGGPSTARDWCSSSGTLSSTCTPGGSPSSDSGSGFNLQSFFSTLELDVEERARKLGHMKRLLEEFSNGNDALERWFLELDVGWLLQLGSCASAGRILVSRPLRHLTRSWILALREVKESIFAYLDGMCSEEESVESASQPGVSEFARFVQATLLKMLPFVDALVALHTLIDDDPSCSSSSEYHAAATSDVEKLQALIDVRDALSTASEHVQFCPHSSLCSIDEVSDLLSSKLGQLDKVIWDTTDEIRTCIMASMEGTGGSPDIHKVTRSVIGYIKLLDTNHVLMSRVAYDAAQLGSYVPEIQSVGPLNSLVMEMFSSLEVKLVSLSRSLPCDGLGFLFLINNSDFIWQQLHPMFGMEFPMAVLNRKIDDYIQSYLQASWGPVVSCLYYDPTPLCLGRHTPLPRFESEFHKIYDAQKLWKVPDPELRTRLRNAIIKKVNSVFRKFLEEYSNVTSPGVSPQKLEDMLQDLFEG